MENQKPEKIPVESVRTETLHSNENESHNTQSEKQTENETENQLENETENKTETNSENGLRDDSGNTHEEIFGEESRQEPVENPSEQSVTETNSGESEASSLTKTPLRIFELLRYENTRHSDAVFSDPGSNPDPTARVLTRKHKSIWNVN